MMKQKNFGAGGGGAKDPLSDKLELQEFMQEFTAPYLIWLFKEMGYTVIPPGEQPNFDETGWINPEYILPLEEHRGEKVFDYFIVAMQLKDGDKHDTPEAGFLRFYADTMEWEKFSDNWEVAYWRPFPKLPKTRREKVSE